MLSVLLALAPAFLVFGLLIFRRTPGDIAGLVGWAAYCLVAWLYFDTPLIVLGKATVAGLLASLPVALIFASSIFQITIMGEAGAVARVSALLKGVAPTDRAVQMLIITFGFGILLTSLGAVPNSILPPILLALGYSTFACIMLPCIGYEALCTYALLGIPAVIMADITGTSLFDTGMAFARFMPYLATAVAVAMVPLALGRSALKSGLVPAVLSGLTAGFLAIGMVYLNLVTITGIAAGLGVIVMLIVYLKVRGQPLVDRSMLTPADLEAEKKLSLLRAISPWLLLTTVSIVINTHHLPLFKFVFVDWAMPVEIIPGKPDKLRLFWQAYVWIFICTLLAVPILKMNSAQIKAGFRRTLARAPRPTMAGAIFFAIAYVLNHSGKTEAFELINPANNIIAVLATASSDALGSLYAFAAPYLGLFAGVISGSESSSIAMLTGLNLSTANQIGANGLLIAAAGGIGGGLASVLGPAKLMAASVTIDRLGEENAVLRASIPLSLFLTAIISILCLVWA